MSSFASHLLGMATTAVVLRERDTAVAGSAVLPGKEVDHAVLVSPLFHPDEDIRMADFTAIPDGVLLVGEDDLRDTVDLGTDGEILLV